MSAPLRALFLVEDAPFQFDSRIRRETTTLRDAGVEITVICPAASDHDPLHYVEDGIEVHQYRVREGRPGVAGHMSEYAWSLLQQSRLAARVFRRGGFDLVHVGNPPDLLWLVALPYKLAGRRFIYDHHDLVPELFEERFPRMPGLMRALVRGCEGASFRMADHVISINETCRQLAIDRGGRRPEQVTVVRNGPRQQDFPVLSPDPTTAALGRTVVGYLGHMNPQDNLEAFLEMARVVRLEEGRQEVGFVMVGTGTDWPRLVRLRDEWGLTDAVYMPGRLPWEQVIRTLTATQICVQPDLPNPFNHKVTMNKLMEYMALGKAVVSFDLRETRVSGGEAVLYAGAPTGRSLAEAVLSLVDDPARARSMGEAARRRVEEQLGWQHQEEALCAVYERLFPGRLSRAALAAK